MSKSNPRSRRRGIVARQIKIAEKTQKRLLDGVEGKGWHTILRGEGGAERLERLDVGPARDPRDVMSALNSSTTVISRLDDATGDHDDAKSLIADFIG